MKTKYFGYFTRNYNTPCREEQLSPYYFNGEKRILTLEEMLASDLSETNKRKLSTSSIGKEIRIKKMECWMRFGYYCY